jgi:hypothetical protein
MLLGDLEPTDLEEVQKWQPIFNSKGWQIEVRRAVPRNEMMSLLANADGFLILSASKAALPSKLFEYLPFTTPIFAATEESGALWRLGESVAQIFLTDYRYPDASAAQHFLAACASADINAEVPEQFAEHAIKKIFLGEVRATIRGL